MARIRTIKPEFPQSESMGRVSRDARLLFVLLWTICDDSGKARAASRMVASLLFPYDDDAPDLVDGWFAELEREGVVTRYVVDGSTYLQVEKWLKHQKIDKPSPSRLPDFVEASRTFAKPREPSTPDLVPRTVVSRIKVSSGPKEEVAADAAPPLPVSKPLSTCWPEGRAVPEEWLEAAHDARNRAGKSHKGLEEDAARFANHFGANGKRMKNWKLAWLNWATSRFVDEPTNRSNANGKPNGRRTANDTIRDIADEIRALEDVQHGGRDESASAVRGFVGRLDDSRD